MKILLFVMVILILVVNFVGAETNLEECQRVQNINDIPCKIVSSFIPATGCNKNITVFTINTTVLNSTWQDGTPFCEYTWNITSPLQTYIYNSTIETGVITLIQDNNMLSIILVQIFIIIFFIAIGLPHKVGPVKFTSWGLALIETLITVWIIYIVEIGASITSILRINAISMLFLGGGFGIYTLIIMNIKLMNVDDSKKIPDDGYTKWVQEK